MKILLLPFLFVVLLGIESPVALAFECPKHLKEAQAAIDKVSEDMKSMKKGVSKTDHALVHALIDDAKMLLAGAKHNHEKPQGDYDHARAIVNITPLTFRGEGTVVLADPRKSQIVLDHKEIPGFMAEMIMGYSVKSAKLLQDLKPGDKIRFTIDADEKAIVGISRVEK